MPGVEIVAEPQLSVVAFRLVQPGLDGEALNRLNRDLIARVNARQRIHLSGTVLHGALRPPDLRPLVPDPPAEAR